MLMKLSITTLHHMLSQWSLSLVKLSITIFLICCVNCHSCWWNYSSPTFTICCFSGHCCLWHYPSHLFTICCFSRNWCEWNCTSQQYVMLLQLSFSVKLSITTVHHMLFLRWKKNWASYWNNKSHTVEKLLKRQVKRYDRFDKKYTKG